MCRNTLFYNPLKCNSYHHVLPCLSFHSGTSLLSPWWPAWAHPTGDTTTVLWWWRGDDDDNNVCGFSCDLNTGLFIWKMCVVYIYRMYVCIYRRLPARLGHLAQLGLAHHRPGSSPYTPHSHLLGNSPAIPPSRPLRALPPCPAICLPTLTLNMLSHGPPLTWVEINDEN